MNTITNKKTTLTTALALAVLLLLIPATVSLNAAHKAYATASGTYDINNIKRIDPLSTYSIQYGSEWFISDAIKNFRSDGSMRIDFKDKESDSAFLAGFFKIETGDCASTPHEEISAKFNGGPHTDADATDPTDPRTPIPNDHYADTMDGGTYFDLSGSRFRWEDWHVHYSSDVPPSSSSLSSITVPDMCSTPDGWIGYLAMKVNRDANCDGVADAVSLYQYVDVTGLNPTTGKPQNNWVLSYAKNFNTAQIGLKSIAQSYVENIGQPTYRYQTIRIDGQNQADWLAGTTYKFVTLKQITNVLKDGCSGSGLTNAPIIPSGGENMAAFGYTGGLAPTSSAAVAPTTTSSSDTTATTADTAAVPLETTGTPEDGDNLGSNDNTAVDDSGNNNNNDNKVKEKEDKSKND